MPGAAAWRAHSVSPIRFRNLTSNAQGITHAWVIFLRSPGRSLSAPRQRRCLPWALLAVGSVSSLAAQPAARSAPQVGQQRGGGRDDHPVKRQRSQRCHQVRLPMQRDQPMHMRVANRPRDQRQKHHGTDRDLPNPPIPALHHDRPPSANTVVRAYTGQFSRSMASQLPDAQHAAQHREGELAVEGSPVCSRGKRGSGRAPPLVSVPT